MNHLCHDEFFRSIRVSGVLESIGRVHVGSGNVEATFEESESLLIRIKKEDLDLPYIPGSSLKGIFRSTIEYILNSIGEYTCSLQTDNKCFEVGKRILRANRARDHESVKKEVKNFCLACKIFGGHNYLSNVIIYDSIPVDSSSIKFDISPGIAINRRDATTMRGALFTVEHINPHSFLSFQIQINNLPNYLIGLLFNVISLINKAIILIGGKKRAGLGQVSIIIDKIEIMKLDDYDSIDYNSINNIVLDKFKLEKIDEEGVLDFDIDISLSDLKQKSKEDFSKNIINYFTKAWEKYVEYKKNQTKE